MLSELPAFDRLPDDFHLRWGDTFERFVLGWSVAWPPGPINAEMIRRSVLSSSKGGGFWSAWRLGLGACTGDFLWALGVAVGAGGLLNTPGGRRVLGFITFGILVFLAFIFAVGAWRAT